MPLLLLAALLAANPRLELSLQSGGELRSPYPGEVGPEPSRMVDVTPDLGLFLEDHGDRLQARYAPRLFLGDVRGVRHDALLAGNWRQTQRLEWLASGHFRYGRSEFAWDPGETRPFDSLETLLPLVPDELSTDARVGFAYLASRTVSINASAGYAACTRVMAVIAEPMASNPRASFPASATSPCSRRRRR